jgi:hypothetical protein
MLLTAQESIGSTQMVTPESSLMLDIRTLHPCTLWLLPPQLYLSP